MTEPYYQSGPVTLYHGDCIEVMRTLPDASVHAVVTDPPYGLEFMGKEWDGADGFRRSLNQADAGRDSVFGRTSRTSPEYRTASKSAAGMSKPGIGERDIAWPSHLGGLNPKCLSCGKWQRGGSPCVCEAPQFTNERLPRLHAFQEWCEVWAAECLRVLVPGGFLLSFGGTRTWHRLAVAIEDVGFEMRDSIAWLYGSGFPKHPNVLKPAFEPIAVARKPMIGTLAVNVAAHGAGGLNVDANRVGDGSGSRTRAGEATESTRYTDAGGTNFAPTPGARGGGPDGRWPTNVLLDESQAEVLDAQSGTSRDGVAVNRNRNSTELASEQGWGFRKQSEDVGYGGEGGASRFFPTFRYEAKASGSERPNADGVLHPTVKPIAVMQWLVRLVAVEGGVILDPFVGSGTTAEACMREGVSCIAIERDATYLPLILQRLAKPHAQALDLGDIA